MATLSSKLAPSGLTTLDGTETLSNKTLVSPIVSGNITVSGNVDGRDVAADGTKLDGIKAGSDVTGPASATDNAITRFDGTTGKIVQNSSVTISDAGVITGNGSGLTNVNAATLDSLNLSQIIPKQSSFSDFINGTLVTTDIPASATNGDSYVIEVTGKSYVSTDPPFSWIGQGYLYNNTIINHTALSLSGYAPAYMKVFQHSDGNLAFWWPRISYWNSFSVKVREADGNQETNRVVAITDSTEPTSAKKVQTNILKSWTEFNDGAGSGLDADLLDGQQGSYYLDYNNFTNTPSGGVTTGKAIAMAIVFG